MKNRRLWLAGKLLRWLTLAVVLVGPLSVAPLSAIAAEENSPEPDAPEPRPYAPLRIPTNCPDDTATLTELMIRDLPSYINRVLQRTVAVLPWTEADELRVAEGEFVRSPYRPSHVLIAGNLEQEPLDLNDYAFTTDPEAGGPLEQVFFTTLSRQYSGLRFEQVQEYHWLFLTQTTAGWRLAFMFSQLDDVTDVRGPLPPRENSLGTVGQAVRIWLRDCRAGAIERLE